VLIGTIYYLLFAPSHEQVLVTKSPGGNILASVEEVYGGVTTSFGYDVFVEPYPAQCWHWGRIHVAYFYGPVRKKTSMDD
jgi:hypothetical protein